MEVFDKNLTLNPPKDFSLVSVSAPGSYIQLTYVHTQMQDERIRLTTNITIYLNEMGREVLRVKNQNTMVIPEVHVHEDPQPVRRWFRFRNSFYVVLEAIQELFRCLKSR